MSLAWLAMVCGVRRWSLAGQQRPDLLRVQLGEQRLAVGGAVGREPRAHRRDRLQALWSGDLVDEDHVVAVEDRQVDGLVDLVGEALELGPDLLAQLAEGRGGEAGEARAEPHAARGRDRHQEALGGQRLHDPVHRRAGQLHLLRDLGEAQASGRRLQRGEDPGGPGDGLHFRAGARSLVHTTPS